VPNFFVVGFLAIFSFLMLPAGPMSPASHSVFFRVTSERSLSVISPSLPLPPCVFCEKRFFCLLKCYFPSRAPPLTTLLSFGIYRSTTSLEAIQTRFFLYCRPLFRDPNFVVSEVLHHRVEVLPFSTGFALSHRLALRLLGTVLPTQVTSRFFSQLRSPVAHAKSPARFPLIDQR